MKKVKCLLKSVLPCLAALFLTIIAYFAAFALSVILGLTSVSTVEGALVDEGLFNILRYVMILIFCGFMYYKTVTKKANDKEEINLKQQILVAVIIILVGIAIQFATSYLLYFLEEAFHGVFTDYQKMENALKTKKSVMYFIALAFLGPIAEEMLFRGLTLNILKKEFNIWIAIIIQALIFGVYHGNLVQFVYATLMGVPLGYLVKKYDTIIPGILLHIVINASFFFMPV